MLIGSPDIEGFDLRLEGLTSLSLTQKIEGNEEGKFLKRGGKRE